MKKTVYHEVRINKHVLTLALSDDGAMVIVYSSRDQDCDFDRAKAPGFADSLEYNRLDELVKKLPEMSDPRFVEPFAVVANFLFSPLKFEVIEDIGYFCANYKRILKENANVLEYGVFDVSVIRKPYIEGSHAIIYVEELSSGLPYKLICPFPYANHLVPFKYSLLPYA